MNEDYTFIKQSQERNLNLQNIYIYLKKIKIDGVKGLCQPKKKCQ